MTNTPHKTRASELSSVLIALGSSLGNRKINLDQATARINAQVGSVTSQAQYYENRPIGGVATEDFLNSAVLCETSLDPLQTLVELQKIEISMGRTRDQHWADRTIDLDIALWQTFDGTSLVLKNEKLRIPHPLMLERDFVMIPAAEIAGSWAHPIEEKLLRQIVIDRKFQL